MFCVECGKEGQIYKNGVCISCYIKNTSFTKGPQIIDIYTCPLCSSYKYKNTWSSDPFENILKRFIKDTFDISKELEKVEIETEFDAEKKIIDCKVTISGFIGNNKVSEEHRLEVRLRKMTCEICSKKYGGYYEAILQVRVDKRKEKEELRAIISSVENLVESMRAKGNRGLFITDIGEEHGGVDFYLSEKGSAYTIAKKIQEQYGGEIKQSSKNIGMKDSRQIYRMTYLIRLPSYQKGDFISFNNSYYLIISMSGQKVHMIELSSWEEKVVDGKKLQKTNIVGGEELIKETILVSQSKNELQIMDPKTYKTVEIRKPKDVSFDSKTVKIVKIDDKVFLFPEKSIIDK